MKAVRGSKIPFLSVLGVPLLGLGALILCLWNPHLVVRPDDGVGTMIVLLNPDPHLDRTFSICLREQAGEVARYRRRAQPERLAQAISGYNLIARECAPTVFQRTGLPPSLEE